jgi:arginyl-tRNA synthetase
VPAFKDIDPALLEGGHELFVAIGRLPQALREAAQKREPVLLAHALLKIASAGNGYYRENRVLGTGDPALEDARLSVIDALRSTLALGLELLGVPVPEQM